MEPGGEQQTGICSSGGEEAVKVRLSLAEGASMRLCERGEEELLLNRMLHPVKTQSYTRVCIHTRLVCVGGISPV